MIMHCTQLKEKKRKNNKMTGTSIVLLYSSRQRGFQVELNLASTLFTFFYALYYPSLSFFHHAQFSLSKSLRFFLCYNLQRPKWFMLKGVVRGPLVDVKIAVHTAFVWVDVVVRKTLLKPHFCRLEIQFFSHRNMIFQWNNFMNILIRSQNDYKLFKHYYKIDCAVWLHWNGQLNRISSTDLCLDWPKTSHYIPRLVACHTHFI